MTSLIDLGGDLNCENKLVPGIEKARCTRGEEWLGRCEESYGAPVQTNIRTQGRHIIVHNHYIQGNRGGGGLWRPRGIG